MPRNVKNSTVSVGKLDLFRVRTPHNSQEFRQMSEIWIKNPDFVHWPRPFYIKWSRLKKREDWTPRNREFGRPALGHLLY